MGLFHFYDIGNTEIYVFDDFMIKQVKEGVFIDKQDVRQLVEIIDKHFKSKKFGFISNRVNSYTINPLTYSEANKIDNLIVFAVITNDAKMRETSEFENKFHNKPFSVFENLSDAIVWINDALKQNNNQTNSTSLKEK
ncbi:hypothetical protein [Olleya sp. UBA1516]|uniref:hypothetical protein n=1 Tax=Olleya sp. UBA1516 TaxID=1947013 RepID=UPI0025FBF473|nr:hypothetical protein [Olleya sp. UBA1516]|tara:strand:+ start:138 stop:551 length:414 start_codon:yes stop_codon:yes gene_type:complete